MAILDRRILGQTTQFPVAGSQEPTPGVTITNNVAGYLLQATGENDRIEGIPSLQWDATNTVLSASSDLYVTGSANYLYLHGTNAAGKTVRFQVGVEGSILKVIGGD